MLAYQDRFLESARFSRILEESSKKYSSAAFMVKGKNKPLSRIRIVNSNGNKGVIEFPYRFSQSEKEAVINHEVSYREVYTCFNEGEILGLLQGWDYNIEVLNIPNIGMKLEERVTV